MKREEREDRQPEIRPGSGAGLGPEPEPGEIAGGTGMVERDTGMVAQRVAMFLDARGASAGDALDRLQAALDGTVGRSDADGLFEVVVCAASFEAALDLVWSAVAAAGVDDAIRFAEHPNVPEHWRRRAGDGQ